MQLMTQIRTLSSPLGGLGSMMPGIRVERR